MSRADVFLWIALPYLCIAVFVVGHIWRYRRDQLSWTARSTQILEQRLLRWGSWLFHLGILALIVGHVLGIVIPKSVTDWIGINADVYHWLAIVAGLAAGFATVAGLAILLFRRLRIARVRATTSWSDLALYPLLALVVATGMAATLGDNLIGGEYEYRLTVSPWFRDIFRFSPSAILMANAPLTFQLHGISAWLLIGIWPFSRLVHAWSIPLLYVRRRPIPYRSRTPAASLARERARLTGASSGRS